MSRGGCRIKIVESFRWGSVLLETDGAMPPVIDLTNPSGLNTYEVPDTEWNLDTFDDGWSSDIELVKGKMSSEKLKKLEELFREKNLEGLEEDGWQDEGECEWWFFGPLQLEDEAGNVIGKGAEE
jgi:hypothetical protein